MSISKLLITILAIIAMTLTVYALIRAAKENAPRRDFVLQAVPAIV